MKLFTNLLLGLIHISSSEETCKNQIKIAIASSQDPCTLACWRSEFAAEKTIIQKYEYIKENKGWKTHTEGIANAELQLFCPYETSQTNNRSKKESMIYLWKARTCPNGFKNADFNTELCLDREHMFQWMVWALTGLGPNEFYICLKPQVRQAYPDFDRTNAKEIKDVTPAGAYDFATHRSNCEAKGGELNFNGWDGSVDKTFRTRMQAWKSGEETVFGGTYIQYCFYSGMTQNSACQKACDDFLTKKNAGELTGQYGKNNKETHDMYCSNDGIEEKADSAQTLRILQDPNTNFFEYFMKSNYATKNIVFGNRNAKKSALTQNSAATKTLAKALLAIFVVIFMF